MGDRKKYSSKYALSSKVFCGCCGANFKRRTWNSNNVSKKVVWQCRTYVNEGKEACDAKAVNEHCCRMPLYAYSIGCMKIRMDLFEP
nr:zinc ribbon domain-containing protein [Paenibacillus alba]